MATPFNKFIDTICIQKNIQKITFVDNNTSMICIPQDDLFSVKIWKRDNTLIFDRILNIDELRIYTQYKSAYVTKNLIVSFYNLTNDMDIDF